MFGPCKMLQPYFAASSGFCPPCFIIEPPKKTVLQILKKDCVCPNEFTKYISISLVIFSFDS